jgi:sorbitol-specific phosphotransferase system component IIA
MRDGQAGRLRYLIHFSDGGAGMRYRDDSLDVGAELNDGGLRYVIERVGQPANPNVLGHAWARLDNER